MTRIERINDEDLINDAGLILTRIERINDEDWKD